MRVSSLCDISLVLILLGHPQFSEEWSEVWRNYEDKEKKGSSCTNEACVSQNYMNIWHVYSEYINF